MAFRGNPVRRDDPFNISTASALWAHAVKPERRLWAPDALGSLAFLISGVLGVIAVTAVVGIIELKSRDWQGSGST